MYTIQLEVENVKCAGCVHTIQDAMQRLHNGVTVEVSEDKKTVTVTSNETVSKETLASELATLGYPEKK